MSEVTQPADRPVRRRRPPRRTSVTGVEQVTRKLVRVTVSGEDLEGFGPVKPGAHIKLFFPADASAWNYKDPDAPRPPSRTYTPLHYDDKARSMQIEFVMHGEGIASGWAQTAKVGDPLHLAGPGGGYEMPQDIRSLIIVADETAMPAAGMLVDAAPSDCKVTALLEIPDAGEERPLSIDRSISPTWLRRDGAQGGTLIARAVAGLSAPEDAYWWIACEANAMRSVRTHLLKERKIAAARVHTRGYWRLGETNYPDHDYGDGN